jgi:uncharacterized protein (TIGR02246 family)
MALFKEVADMARHLIGAFVAAAVVASASCGSSSPAVDAPADIAAVNALRTAFQTAFNAGDALGVAKSYTATAIAMGNHQPSSVGRDAIAAATKAEFAAMKPNIQLTADETKTVGNMGFDRGRFKITLTPKGGGTATVDEGRYLVLLEKGSDGAWKVSRDIENSTLPLPKQVSAAAPKAPTKPATKAPAKAKAKGKSK